MKDYIVRIWVDVKVKSVASREAALDVAKKLPIIVVKDTPEAEAYDMQVSGQVWEKNE